MSTIHYPELSPQGFEVFCPNESCGDPITNHKGDVFFTKRKMTYAGRSLFLGDWIFRCPVCGRKRKFNISLFGNIIDES